MNNLVEISKDKQVVTTSVRMAEVFGKRHDNILRQINSLIGSLREQQDFSPLKNEEAKFAVANYKDEQGKFRKQYIMNRDGFTLLAMGFTGSKALKFKLQYIQAFNEMEAKLRKIYPCGEVNVREHTRSLPSGRKEIVLSEKAKAEIGGIVKNCLAAALEGKRPGISGTSPNMTATLSRNWLDNEGREIKPEGDDKKSLTMTAEIDYNKLSAGVGGWVSMTLMSARYDDLKREAESLRRQAELCEKQAAEPWKSVKKIESAFGI